MAATAQTPPDTGDAFVDGYILHELGEIDGTNAEALRAGAPPGHIYMARSQSAGRGRQGREWVSPLNAAEKHIGQSPRHLRRSGIRNRPLRQF